jgi:hypothetical protein
MKAMAGLLGGQLTSALGSHLGKRSLVTFRTNQGGLLDDSPDNEPADVTGVVASPFQEGEEGGGGDGSPLSKKPRSSA